MEIEHQIADGSLGISMLEKMHSTDLQGF